MIPDPANDGKKCSNSSLSMRTFTLTDQNVSLEKCTKACADDPDCMSVSMRNTDGQSKFCMGCKQALTDDESGTTAFKKSKGGFGGSLVVFKDLCLQHLTDGLDQPCLITQDGATRKDKQDNIVQCEKERQLIYTAIATGCPAAQNTRNVADWLNSISSCGG